MRSMSQSYYVPPASGFLGGEITKPLAVDWNAGFLRGILRAESERPDIQDCGPDGAAAFCQRRTDVDGQADTRKAARKPLHAR